MFNLDLTAGSKGSARRTGAWIGRMLPWLLAFVLLGCAPGVTGPMGATPTVGTAAPETAAEAPTTAPTPTDTPIIANTSTTAAPTATAVDTPPPPESPATTRPLPFTVDLPPGFNIGIYAENVPNARSLALSPAGTLFVGTRYEGTVYAVLDHDGDHQADEVIPVLQEMNTPNGVAVRDGALYVAEVNRVLRFDDIEADLYNPPQPVIVNDDFPSDALHGWKFIRFGPDGKLYVPVGAPCNVCDTDGTGYAQIRRMDADGSNLEIYAEGIRNSVGFDWHPQTQELWFTDNGRDLLGDDLPPDELNHAPQAGLHFGYPYCHGGTTADPEFGQIRDCSEFVPPAMPLGPHVAALGMRFYTGDMFPPEYHNQIFIAEHGSWNRSVPIGYRLTLVRLEDNRAVSYEPFASGWLRDGSVYGRPVDVLVMPDGALLVSDDSAGMIYRIWYEADDGATTQFSAPAVQAYEVQEYTVPSGSHPHDVAPAGDGTVWYTAQHSGELGRLDPASGATHHIPLGEGSRPHGVIVGPDGAAWVTDGGLNAIVRVDANTEEVTVFPLPADSGYANLNTATFDQQGVFWFTGQSGIYGRLDPQTGEMAVFAAPGGGGPYGITTTPSGDVYYASLAGNHIARIDVTTGEATVIEPPTPGQGARRVWSDSQGHIWVSEWDAGQVARYDPATDTWHEWPLPGNQPRAYAVYVDAQDSVWLTDFGANAIVRFDAESETFESFELPSTGAAVRQLLGRRGEVWGAESGTDTLVVIRSGT